MIYPEIQELNTLHLHLRKMRREDAPCYYARLGSSEAVTRYMLFDPHQDPAEAEISVEKVLQRYESGRCYRWAIALPEDDSLIGIVELLRFDEEKNSCSFAYMIGEEFWGKGYGTETLRAVFGFAFEKMGIQAIEADHMSGNPASGRAMQKAGMTHICTEPGKYEKHGTVYDAPVYRITAEEWKNSLS